MYWFSLFFTVAITGATLWFIVKYKRKKGDKLEPPGNVTVLEITWTVIPVLFIVVLFHVGFKGYVSQAVPYEGRPRDPRPRDPLEVGVRVPERNAGERRPAAPGEQAGEADSVVGRRHPQLLRPGLPPEEGRRPRHVLVDLVPPEHARATRKSSARSTAGRATPACWRR